MKNKKFIIFIVIVILIILSFIIPIETKWVNDSDISDVGHYAYYNIYGMKLWNK